MTKNKKLEGPTKWMRQMMMMMMIAFAMKTINVAVHESYISPVCLL
jgi:hypothetical protein